MAHLIPAKGVIDETHPLAIGMYRGAGSHPETRQVIEGSDCLICVGARFTDVASGFFTHQLDSESIIDLQPFGLKVDDESFNAVAAAELLSGLVTQPHRTRPPAPVTCNQRPETTEEPSANGSFTYLTVWHHIEKFLQPGDLLVTDTETSFFASSNLNLPPGDHLHRASDLGGSRVCASRYSGDLPRSS